MIYQYFHIIFLHFSNCYFFHRYKVYNFVLVSLLNVSISINNQLVLMINIMMMTMIRDDDDDDDQMLVLYAVRAMPAYLLSAQGQPTGVRTTLMMMVMMMMVMLMMQMLMLMLMMMIIVVLHIHMIVSS